MTRIGVPGRTLGTPAGSLPAVPAAAFVLVWSSGYIVAPFGVEAMQPLTMVAARFGLAALLVTGIALALRRPFRVARGDLWRIAAVGFVINGCQFATMFSAFELGMQSTLGSLLHSLTPVTTALLAALLLGERLRAVQTVGFAIGVVGVLIVLGPGVERAGGAIGLALGVASMLSLSLGTLGQRLIGHAPDPWWSAAIQFAVTAPPMLALALAVEGTDTVSDPRNAAIALGWQALVNSVTGLMLLGVLARRGGAGAAGSVFFLMPPITAVLAWVLLGEVLGVRGVVGLVVAVVGVVLATRSRATQATGG